MTLNELAEITPSTTPMRIFVKGNPYKPLVNLIYSDTLLRGHDYFRYGDVVGISAHAVDDLGYLIVTIEDSEA